MPAKLRGEKRENMKEETDGQGRSLEYDFTRGERGFYAERFKDRREEVLQSAASLDGQAWIAHSLESFQIFEAYLVAYWALALRKDPPNAGRAVTSLLHDCDSKPLKVLRRILKKFTSADDSFYTDLMELIEDRNWLVHKSFQSFSSARLHSIAQRSEHLTSLLSSFLLERCRHEGMDEVQIKARTAEVVKQWAADKNAA